MRSYFIAAAVATLLASPAFAETETAIFAGGCFWCVEKDLDHVNGVISTTSGYAGGTMANPTYRNHEGNQEAVKVVFDNAMVSYEVLVNHFLRTIDVTDADGQFCDRGESYQSAIFTEGESQMETATKAIARASKDLGQPVVTPVKPATTFADAEDYHQNYYLGENRVLTRFGYVKQSEAYAGYRDGCGRDAQVKKIWGDKAHSFPVPQGSS